MKPIRFLRPAELELLDAAQYYELQATGLGGEFLDKIDAGRLRGAVRRGRGKIEKEYE